MISRTILICLLFTLYFSCGTDNGKGKNTAVGSPTLPSIDVTRLEYLFANATYMDATFYNIPVSINQSELPQIQQTIATVSTESMTMQSNCKAVGHIWFQVNGKNIEEADIYFEPDCIGYVWYENGKPAYSNRMTQEGVNFYGNIFQQVQSGGQGQ